MSSYFRNLNYLKIRVKKKDTCLKCFQNAIPQLKNYCLY